MLELLLTIIFGTFVIIFFKVISILKLDVQQIITINYLVAASFGFIIWNEPLSFELWQAKPWFWLSPGAPVPGNPAW